MCVVFYSSAAYNQFSLYCTSNRHSFWSLQQGTASMPSWKLITPLMFGNLSWTSFLS